MENKDTRENFLLNCLNQMKKKQNLLMKKYNFGKENNKFIMLPDKNLFYMYNSETNKTFFEAKIQIIGTYSNKSNTWRWGWSNRFVAHNMKKSALKILQFGKVNKINILTKPKIRDDNLGYIFTSIGLKLSNGKGYYIIPATKIYPDIFIIFTNVKKINKNYDDIIKDNKKFKYNLSKKNKNIYKLTKKNILKRKKISKKLISKKKK